MFNITRKSVEWGGRTLTLETGRIARQADGAVLATYGNTAVLCTVVGAKKPKPELDFFPLTVHYQEKTYAAGKIPGGFFKREGRPTEKEVLTSRLIDRPIRPLFPEGYRNETQVICTLISQDSDNDADIVAMVGVSAALTLSGIPFMGPIGGARVAYIDGEYVLNPTIEENKDKATNKLDLIVAGTMSSVLMVESEADQLPEDIMLGAVMFGHKEMQPVIKTIIELAEDAANEPRDFVKPEIDAKLVTQLTSKAEAGLREAYKLTVKQERSTRLDEVKSAAKEQMVEAGFDEKAVGTQLKKMEQDIVRGDILKNKTRIDGRELDKVRQIDAQVGVLPMAHGSALFTRGETQALVVTTLGTGSDEQIIDALHGEYRENFMLHYNFPPYSVGEATPMRPPGRREIGHGKLAWRSVKALLPTKEEFPYTMRVVSEITESNGSSSMATVCGTSLSLMDAGAPFKKPVAGIAMGLIKEGDEFAVLSDIMGDEDHLGDMDFKVAGTEDGLTALQMDIKIDGITEEIMKIALDQAQAGRKYILVEMAKALTSGRDDVNANAPRITTIKIDKEKIREVIGSGGKVIREICEVSGAKVDIDDEGMISVAAISQEATDKALEMINGIVEEPELGKIYEGKVVRVVDFGAFVNFMGAKDGLLHISELADHRVEQVEDIVKEGDTVKVKVIEMDRGKVRLSLKVVDQDSGEDLAPGQLPEPRQNRGGPRRDNKRRA